MKNHKELLSGLLLISAALVALAIANSSFSSYYTQLLQTSLNIQFGTYSLSKPLLLWINDGLMTLFFLLVGLEIKKEMLGGLLKERHTIILPAIAALGGMIVPALFYIFYTYHESNYLNGWAVPVATDIAFSLGVLALLGSRIPRSLKLFLTTLAILDDIGAIVIIAIFYTDQLSTSLLLLAALCIFILFIFNRAKINNLIPYGLVGLILWLLVLKSGVHATLAGVLLAWFIPYKTPTTQVAPLVQLEKDLHPWVHYLVLPLFAFANSGLNFHSLTLQDFSVPITSGIFTGLFLGKPLGIFFAALIVIKLGVAKLPQNTNWISLWGVAWLCGIGFTMSLFIGTLAFENTAMHGLNHVKLGVFSGSLLSALLGYFVLRVNLKKS